MVLIYHPLFLYKEVAMDYKQIITRDNITTKLTKRGYNLNDNGILENMIVWKVDEETLKLVFKFY